MREIFEENYFRNYAVSSLINARGQIKGYSTYGEQIITVFISHKHIDHLLGLIPFIRKVITSIKLSEYEEILNIYCDKEIKEIVDYVEGKGFFDGNLYVPDDLGVIDLD